MKKVISYQWSVSSRATLAVLALITVHCSLITAPAAAAATVTGTFRQSDGTPFVGDIVFRPAAQARLAGGAVLTSDTITVATDTNGVVSTTLLPGNYGILVGGTQRFTIGVIDTNASLAIPNIILSGAITNISTTPLPSVYVDAGGVIAFPDNFWDANVEGLSNALAPTFATKLSTTNGVAVNLSTPTTPTASSNVVNLAAMTSAVASGVSTNAPLQVATLAALRAATIVTNAGQPVAVGGYVDNGDGGGGLFWYDATDTDSTDNGFSVVVSTTGGRRYKRIIDKQVTPMMFGAKGNGTGDDSGALLRAILWCKTNNYTLDGLGRVYRLTNSIGARADASGNLATDGYGQGMTMRNINFLQAATNCPILVWDLSTSTNLVAGDGGWVFQNLSFNWSVKPAADHTNSAAFYLSAPAIISASRDYALIYNSVLRDITFATGHTGILIRGKANFWGNRCLNLNWYGNWSGPGIDFSDMLTYQASAPGNTFDGLYARVDGFTSTAQDFFFHVGAQQEASIRNVEFNQGVAAVKQYIVSNEPKNLSIRTVRLEGGSWSPSYQGFITLINPQAGITVEDLALYNVNVGGNGYFVRLPVAGPATDTQLKRFVFDTCRLTNAALYGVAGSGNVGEITPVQALSPSLSNSSWGHIFGDGTALTWGLQRSSRLWTSSDRGDASVTLVPGTDAGLQLFATALTANRTVTLSTSGVDNGDEFAITRTGGGPYSLAVGGLVTFGPHQTGTVRVRYVASGSYGGGWTLVMDGRNPAPEIALAASSRAGDATLLFDGVTANSRAWWPLGSGTSVAASPLTVLAVVGNNGVADSGNRGIWTFSSGNNAYSASSLSLYRATNALCVELTGASVGTDFRRRYVQGFFTNMPVREIPVAVTWDRTNAPVIYADGIALTTTETTGGTAPAWTNAIASTYFDLGVLAASERWDNRLRASVVNAALTAAEVARWSASGRAPNYAEARPANVAVYASDFTGGVNGWVAPVGTDAVAGAVTTSPYTSATMRFTAGSFSGQHYAALYNVFTPGRRYRVSGRIQIASGNATMVAFVIKTTSGDYAQAAYMPTLSSWYDFSVEFTPQGTGLLIGGATAASGETFAGNGTDNFILYGLRIAEIGSLFTPSIMAGTSVPDKSGNGITGTLVSVAPWTGTGYDGGSALPAAAVPAFFGGQVTNAAGSLVLSLNTTNANPGTFGSATQTAVIVANTNGLLTALTNVTVTPAIGNVTGLGAGVQAALAQALNGSSGVPSTTAGKFFNSITLGTGTGTQLFYIDGAAGSPRGIEIYSGTSKRWQIATSGSESGGNAGSFLQFQGYDDSGASLSYPMAITRDGTIYMRAGASASAATHFPVFTTSPSSSQTVVVSRTAAQVRSDIGAGTGNGTVTSVAASVPAFLSISGSPVTSSGTLAISYSGTALPVANGGSGATALTGYVKGNGTSAMTAAATVPVSDISSLGTGVGSALGLAPTGSGVLVLATNAVLTTPALTNASFGVTGSAQKVAVFSSSGVLNYGNASNLDLNAIVGLNALTGYLSASSGSAVAASSTIPATDLSGTINSARLPASGVTAGSYGNGSYSATITVDTYGRVTAVTTNAISGGSSSTTSFVVLDGSVGVTTISSGNGFTNGGTIINMTTHGLTTGDVVWFQNSTKGPLIDTAYYVTVVDADNYKVSTSQANRLAGTFIAATADGACFMRRWNSNPILASSNVDGVIRPWSKTAGTYIVDFTTNPSDAYYAVSGSAKTVSDGTPLLFTGESRAATTSAFAVQVTDTSGGLTDSDRVSITATR